METPDRPPEEEAQGSPQVPSRPWGPGSPAPGTPVSAFDVGRNEDAELKASEATALYEAARFPDLDEVTVPAPTSSERGGGSVKEEIFEKGVLRILGVPAPKEIAGPVVAALALVALIYGWRRRRRRSGR